MGATSLENVGGGLFGSWARTLRRAQTVKASKIVKHVTAPRVTSICVHLLDGDVTFERKIRKAPGCTARRGHFTSRQSTGLDARVALPCIVIESPPRL